jgi:hypothetical protein
MPHTFTRRAFELGRTPGNQLLSLYCSLVTVELALKDSVTPWRQGHRIQQWLDELNDAGLNALTYQLATQLLRVICTDRTGNEAPIGVNSYPDLRYVRHETDFPGRTTDADIQRCIEILEDIRSILVGKGIL